VASNNLLCLNKDQNVFDSKKRIKVATASEMEQKLNSIQRRVIGYNEILFAIVTNQKDVAKKLLDKYLGNFNDRERYSLLEMAQLCKEKKYVEAEKLLKECLKTTATTSKKIQYYLIQVLLCQGKTSEAISQFKNLEEFKTFKLGVISAIVTLLKRQNNNKEEITQLLSNAIDYFSKTNVNAVELQTYIKENSQFQIDSGDLQKACEMLEKLRAIRPKDFKILSKLINIYSKFDSEKANKLSKDLPSLEDISAAGSEIDMDLLESQFSLLSSKYSKQLKTLGQLKSPDLKAKANKSDKVKTNASGDNVNAKLKKKKKKIRLPKNFDPKAQVDAERWLPLKERSYYRGKRNKKKGGAIGKGTQGAVGGKEMPQSPRAVAETESVKLPDKLKPKPASAAANLKKKKKGGSKW
jgi:signal recognition particle subunit SRP72